MIRRDPKLYRDGSVGVNRRSRDRWTSQPSTKPSTKPDVINGSTSKQIEGYVNNAEQSLNSEINRVNARWQNFEDLHAEVDARMDAMAYSAGNQAQGRMASKMAEELLASAEPSQEKIVQKKGQEEVDTLHAAIVKDIDELFARCFEKCGVPGKVYYALQKLSKELDDPNLDSLQYQMVMDNFDQVSTYNEAIQKRLAITETLLNAGNDKNSEEYKRNYDVVIAFLYDFKRKAIEKKSVIKFSRYVF